MAVCQACMCWCNQNTCLLQFAGSAWHKPACLLGCGHPLIAEKHRRHSAFKFALATCQCLKDKTWRSIVLIQLYWAQQCPELNSLTRQHPISQYTQPGSSFVWIGGSLLQATWDSCWEQFALKAGQQLRRLDYRLAMSNTRSQVLMVCAVLLAGG